MEDLRQLHQALHAEVEGFLLERRVSRSLAGLEQRGRSPQPPTAHQQWRNNAAGLRGMPLRRSASADTAAFEAHRAAQLSRDTWPGVMHGVGLDRGGLN